MAEFSLASGLANIARGFTVGQDQGRQIARQQALDELQFILTGQRFKTDREKAQRDAQLFGPQLRSAEAQAGALELALSEAREDRPVKALERKQKFRGLARAESPEAIEAADQISRNTIDLKIEEQNTLLNLLRGEPVTPEAAAAVGVNLGRADGKDPRQAVIDSTLKQLKAAQDRAKHLRESGAPTEQIEDADRQENRLNSELILLQRGLFGGGAAPARDKDDGSDLKEKKSAEKPSATGLIRDTLLSKEVSAEGLNKKLTEEIENPSLLDSVFRPELRTPEDVKNLYTRTMTAAGGIVQIPGLGNFDQGQLNKLMKEVTAGASSSRKFQLLRPILEEAQKKLFESNRAKSDPLRSILNLFPDGPRASAIR